MAKFEDIDLSRRVEIVPRKETKGFSDFVEGCEAIEIAAEDAVVFIKFISQSKFSVAIENDLQSVSEMADGSGALLSSWMSIADFREMIKDYDQDIADLSEKWQSLGANEVEINGFDGRAKRRAKFTNMVFKHLDEDMQRLLNQGDISSVSTPDEVYLAYIRDLNCELLDGGYSFEDEIDKDILMKIIEEYIEKNFVKGSEPSESYALN